MSAILVPRFVLPSSIRIFKRYSATQWYLFCGTELRGVYAGECALILRRGLPLFLKIEFRFMLLELGESAIGLRVTILASGSSGNMTLLETEHTRLLVMLDLASAKRCTARRCGLPLTALMEF